MAKFYFAFFADNRILSLEKQNMDGSRDVAWLFGIFEYGLLPAEL